MADSDAESWKVPDISKKAWGQTSHNWGGGSAIVLTERIFFSPNDVSFLREESVMEFSHVGSSSKVNETWSLC